MADMSDADFARFADRIMACRDAEDAAKELTKLIYAEAADAGLDKTALGLFVRVERMDQKQISKANRRDELTEEYRARYRRGKASHVRAREEAASVTTKNASVPAGFDPETGEESTTPEITHSDVVDAVPADVRDADDLTAVSPSPQTDSRQVTHSADEANEARDENSHVAIDADGNGLVVTGNGADNRHPGGVNVADARAHIADEEGALNASSAPSNITTLRPAKVLRPNCLKRDMCGASGLEECYLCRKAMQQSGAA